MPTLLILTMSMNESLSLAESVPTSNVSGNETGGVSQSSPESGTVANEISGLGSASRTQRAHRLTITSGKGGVGKSSFSGNLALSLSKRGAKVLLFDADLQLANLDLILGIQPEFTLIDVLKQGKHMREIWCETSFGLKVICGGSGVSQLMSAGPKRLNVFYGQLEELESEFDFIIFDTGAGVDNRMTSFCAHSDESILVTTPDPASITDSYAVVKVTATKAAAVPIGIVFNQVVGPNEAVTLYRILNETTTKFLNRPIAFIGSVRHDDTLRASVRARRPVVTAFPQAPSAIDIEAIAADLYLRQVQIAA